MGPNLVDFISETSGLITTAHLMHDVESGLEAEFLGVFVSRGRAALTARRMAVAT
jgi:hypothetical protein